jgi:hypothetical protein
MEGAVPYAKGYAGQFGRDVAENVYFVEIAGDRRSQAFFAVRRA